MSSAAATLPSSTRFDATRAPHMHMATTRFEVAIVLLGGFLMSGAYLDAWAHRHIASLETFFTPWHGVLYGGVLLTGLFLFVNLMRGRDAGRPWQHALPTGFGLSFVGFVLFGIGGALDLAWHTLFGIERSYAAAISPTHLLLMGSAALMVSGGLRSAWVSNRGRLSYTGLLSTTLLFSVFIFFSQDLHPFINQWSAAGARPHGYVDQFEELGVIEVILQSAILMGTVLFLMRRFALPPFALTILLTVTTAAVVFIWHADPVFFIGIIGGLVADGLRALLRPTMDRVVALRSFAAMMPGAIYLLYFLGILKTDGIWWPIHVWVGAIVIAAVTGLLVSFLVVPPAATGLPGNPSDAVTNKRPAA